MDKHRKKEHAPGDTTDCYLGISLLWALAITVVFAPIAIARYGARNREAASDAGT